MFDAAIFDLDGTLTDPAVGIIGSFRHALRTVGLPVPEPAELTWIIGPPMEDNLVAQGVPEELRVEAAAAFRDRHVDVGVYEAVLHDGIPELLYELRRAGMRLAVATLKPTGEAVTTVEHFGIADRFEAVCGRDPSDVVHDKRGIVGAAAELLGRPGKVAMIGDRIQDVDGGRANGTTTVSVGWGYAPPGELEAAAADHHVERVDELRDLLLGRR